MSTTRRLDLLVFCNFLGLGIIIAAVPRFLHSELHASRFATGAATTVYFVSALIVRPFIGAAVDRAGRRPFLIVPPLFTAGVTLGYLLVHNVVSVGALRFVGGGVAALFFTAAALAVTDSVPPERRTQVLGRQSAMTYSGFIIGPVLADRLLDHGWTIVWLVPAVLHALTGVIGLTLPETRPAGAPVSVARAGFDRRVLRPAAGLLAANFGFSAIVAFLPEYSERMGIGRPGSLFAVYAVSVLLSRLVTARLADRLGPERIILPGLSLGGVALVGLALAQSPWHAYLAIAAVGSSLGATFPAATSAALARVGVGDRGKAMGTTLALGDIGQATAGPLIGYLSTQWGFRWVYLIPALVCVGAAIGVRKREPSLGS